ncbi:unnamed protein product [Owenia fusiformis]|uniref:Uncharacterized protein n=1 Tax=Owenia fusiformis TaxID=6347 RepID=A0A8S4P3E3_OWEFU|nr:unnamed protein product [Owenia fusiformis]
MKVPKTDPFPNFGNSVLPLNESFDNNNNNRALSVYKDRISVTSHNNKNNMADNCSVVSKDNTVIAEISKVTLQTDVLEEADSSMSRISNSTAEWPKDVSPCLAEDITEETHQRFDTGIKMADKSNLALDEKLLRLKLLDAKHNGVINNSTDYDIKYMIDKKQKTQNIHARLKKRERKPPELEEPSSPLISKADRHKLNLLSHGSNRKKIAQHKCAKKKYKNDQMVPSVESAHPKILIVENGCRGLADRAGYTVLSGFKRGPAVANGVSPSAACFSFAHMMHVF